MRHNHNSSDKWKKSFEEYEWWFAWYPVSDGNTTVWLEWVERIRIGSWHEIFWSYKLNGIHPDRKDDL